MSDEVKAAAERARIWPELEDIHLLADYALSQLTLEDARLAEAVELLRRCRDVIDDDLDERPARHSLGRLHAKLARFLAEDTNTEAPNA